MLSGCRSDVDSGNRVRPPGSEVSYALATKPKDAGGYTGEGPLLGSWMREAERNRKRAEAAEAARRED